MVDFLKQSVKELEAPSCPDCNVPMVWFRSMRMSLREQTITHVFQCSGCNRLVEVKSYPGRHKNGNPNKTKHQQSAAA